MKSNLLNKGANAVKFADSLMLIMSIFTVTFFMYRDFDIRMLYGYGLLCVFLLFHFFRRLILKKGLDIPCSSVGASFIMGGTICLSFLRPDSKHDVDMLVYIMSMVICLAFLLFSEPDVKEYKRVYKVLIIGSLAFCAFVLFFSVFEELFWKSYFTILSSTSKMYLLKYVNRGYSPILGSSFNTTDYVIVLGIAAFVGIMLSKEKKGTKNALYFLPILALVFAIFIIGRRGELLAVCLALSVTYFITQNKKQLIIKLTVLIVVGLLLLWVFVAFLEDLKQISFLSRYVMTIEKLLSGKDATSGRLELYAIAFSIFLKNPIFGIGWGSFSNHVPADFRVAHGSEVSNVHNIYLQFLCETGIVGTILILTPIIYIFVKTVSQTRRLYKMTERSEDITLAAKLNGISLTIQTFFLVVGFLDPCFSKNIFWCFFIISVKMLDSATKLEKHTETNKFAKFYEAAVKKVLNKVAGK